MPISGAHYCFYGQVPIWDYGVWPWLVFVIPISFWLKLKIYLDLKSLKMIANLSNKKRSWLIKFVPYPRGLSLIISLRRTTHLSNGFAAQMHLRRLYTLPPCVLKCLRVELSQHGFGAWIAGIEKVPSLISSFQFAAFHCNIKILIQQNCLILAPTNYL